MQAPSPKVDYLHRLRLEGGKVLHVQTTRDALRSTPFLDGRDRFWDDEEWRELPSGERHAGNGCRRYVFHISFCGSTLLAKLLDRPGYVLALKEPHAFVDAAELLHTADEASSQSACILLSALEANLLRENAGEAIVAKLSNWANNLVPLLCDPSRRSTAVFVTMPRADFITAVFRGGRDRMTYTARAIQHLVRQSDEGREALARAVGTDSDPLGQIARMTALSHAFQEAIFKAALQRNGWGNDRWFTMQEVVDDPVASASRACEVLELPRLASDQSDRIVSRMSVHSKGADRPFQNTTRRDENATVLLHHGHYIREACAWAADLDFS